MLSGLRILVAEDDAFNRMIMHDELKWFIPEVQLTIAHDGQSTLEIWQKEAFNVIITDIQMPALSGYALTQQIREMEKDLPDRRKTPILAMTASVLDRDIQKCLQAGMDGYILKPFQSHELLDPLVKLASR